MPYVYILQCNDRTFYTGYTSYPERRYNQHNSLSKTGAKYTKARQPCKRIFIEEHPDRSQAMQRENEIKKLSHDEKLKLSLHCDQIITFK